MKLIRLAFRSICLICLLGLNVALLSAQSLRDTLYQHLETLQPVEKVNYLFDVMYEHLNDRDLAVEVAGKALDEAGNIGNKELFNESLNKLGYLLSYHEEFNAAKVHYIQAVKFSKKNRLPVNEIIDNYSNLAGVYEKLKNYEQVVSTFKYALNLAEAAKDSAQLIEIYNQIGGAYREQNQFETAKSNFEEALVISESLKDSSEISNTLINIGIVLRNREENQQAIYYYQKALIIQEALNNPIDIGEIQQHIGMTYLQMDSTNLAREFLNKATDIWEHTGSSLRKAEAYNALGDAFFKDGDFQRANIYYNYDVHERTVFATDTAVETLIDLGRVKYALGEYEEALQFLYLGIETSLRPINKGENSKTLSRIFVI